MIFTFMKMTVVEDNVTAMEEKMIVRFMKLTIIFDNMTVVKVNKTAEYIILNVEC